MKKMLVTGLVGLGLCASVVQAEEAAQPAGPRIENAKVAVQKDAGTSDWIVSATADIFNPDAAAVMRSLRLAVVDADHKKVSTFKYADTRHEQVCYDCHRGDVASKGREKAALKVRLADKKDDYQVRLTLADAEKKVLQTVYLPLAEKPAPAKKAE